MLIKVPVVLIYNHASLSRKLKISGLFQSTFPQLIQLVILLVIFYSFLSGWQAENLRRSIQDQLKRIEEGKADPAIESYKIDLTATIFPDEAFNYEPLAPLRRLSGTGIIEMRRRDSVIPFIKPKADYFIFSKTSDTIIYLVKVDSQLLKSLTKNLRYLAGTSIVAYPLTPEKWSSYIYKADFLWQREHDIRIFPLGALPQDADSAVSIQLEYPQTRTENILNKLEFLFKDKYQLVFGRVYLPFWQSDSFDNNYLAFDIIMKLEPVILFSGLPQILLVLLVIYLLFNSFVVQQVVKFGSQINETIIQKFGLLQKGIQQIATGNLDHKIKLEGEDEFVELANHFNQMGEQLKKKIAEARERDLFEYELQLAREVQLSLLPQQLPEIPGFQIAASMRTANTVGGDFYDIFSLDKNRYLFTIGDVSGKGSSAALYMAQCMSLVRFSRQFTTEPAEISSRLNSYFAASITDRQIFVTAIIGILDTKSNTLQFIRAGHTEPIFIPGDLNQEIQIIESKGIGIGLTRSSRMFEKIIKSIKMNLKPGNTLVFYTDGVIEAMRPIVAPQSSEFELYGENRLQKLMEAVREKGAAEILHVIEQDVDSFYAGSMRLDDYSVLVIQRVPEI
jgi:serine phosphatase RsbU (regulator of sigma subunit)